MPFEDAKLLEFNQYQKSDKAPSIIYTDLEWLIKTFNGCKNIPEILSTAKIGEHIPSSFSMSTILALKILENKQDVYRDKTLCKSYANPQENTQNGDN